MSEHDTVDPIISRVIEERSQGHGTRVSLYTELEEKFERPVVAFFTSFAHSVMLEDADVDTLAGFLQMMDLANGFLLIISSPGGDGLAAERMINVCRSYSGTSEYGVIVPGKAKSAATMVCFGASKIYMGPTSELGPVDPQIMINDDGVNRVIPAYHVVESYKELFSGAVQEQGHLEPYLQQLQKYDAAMIKNYEAVIELSKDISVGALKSGMMQGESEKKIAKQVEMFLTPERTKTHGRPIYSENAIECGLNVEKIDHTEQIWNLVYELHIRLNHFVSGEAAKCIESKDQSFIARA